MLFNAIKGISVLILSVICLYLVMYYWGGMYGGKQHQRKAFEAGAKILLRDFHRDQEFYLRSTGRYNPNLHIPRHSLDFKDSNFRLGYNDVEAVAKVCPHCAFRDTSYTIAAYGRNDSGEVVYSIDEKGNLVKLSKD